MFEEIVVGYLVPDLYYSDKKNFSEKFPYGIFNKDSKEVETVFVKRLRTKRTKEEAIAACIAANQDPHSYIDYSDLRNGTQNWEYFVEIKNG